MTDFRLTQHGAIRVAQGGFLQDDLKLIELIATEVEGGYFVRKKDHREFEHHLPRLRDRARKLIGKRLVIDGDQVITIYHARRSKERRLLRRSKI